MKRPERIDYWTQRGDLTADAVACARVFNETTSLCGSRPDERPVICDQLRAAASDLLQERKSARAPAQSVAARCDQHPDIYAYTTQKLLINSEPENSSGDESKSNTSRPLCFCSSYESSDDVGSFEDYGADDVDEDGMSDRVAAVDVAD